MIDIRSAVSTVQKKVNKLDEGGVIELKTYKRDRGVKIIKVAGDRLKVVEDGFEKNEFEIPLDKLKKTLKSLLKREFPRSNKVRLSERKSVS